MTSSRCIQARIWMSDFLAGEIMPGEMAPLKVHEAECAPCRAELEQLIVQDRALAELAGESLSETLRARIRTGLAGIRRGRPSRLRWLLAAAAVLLSIVGASWVWHFYASEDPPTVASVERVRGEVFITSKEGDDAAAQGAALRAGQGVKTVGSRSSVLVRLLDGTEFELGGESALDRMDETSMGKSALLRWGKLRASVAPQPTGHPMILSSPQAEATVLGTRLQLIVDRQARSTRLEVEEGKVRLARTQDGAKVDVSAGSFAVAAPGVTMAALPLRPSGKSTIVRAGETLTLSEDLVLSGDDALEIQGTADRPCVLIGNQHQIRASGEWIGRVRISYAEIKGLGDRTRFNEQGKVTSQTPAFDLTGSKTAEVTIEQTTFVSSSSVRLRLDGQSTARFVNNVSTEDSVVSVDKARERSYPFFEATGSSTAAKVFQGNRVYRSGILVTGKNWKIGGESDSESNLIIGLRAALDAFGEGTVVRRNYVHVLMPRTAEYPYWSQVSTFTTAKGALAEHNVIRDGEWIVQFVEGEFRYNLICDINDHNLLRNASTGRIHHNIFVAGKPDHPPGSMGGCIFIVYPPREGDPGAEIFNNTFDAGGTMNVPGLEMNPGGYVKSLRNNVYYNFGHQEKFIRHSQAMIRPVWTEPITDPPPNQLGYADYNAFYSPLAKVKRNYAIGVQGKTERKDAGFALHDLPIGGAPNDQLDPKFRGPLPATFAFSDADIKAGKVTVSQILAFYREAYTPAPGSPLIDAGDPADGEGTDIGAVDAGKPAKPN